MTQLKERTLRKTYESKQGSHTLLEAVDKQKLQQLTQVLSSMQNIVPTGAKMFQKALADAAKDVDAYRQGGIKQWFKNLAGDPFLRATTLINAVKEGLAAMPTIAQAYIPPELKKEAERSVLETVPPAEQKRFLDSMAQAFRVDKLKSLAAGDLKTVFKDEGVPYLSNLHAAVTELMQNVNPVGSFRLGNDAKSVKAPLIEPAQASNDKASAPDTVPTPTNMPDTEEAMPATMRSPSLKPAETNPPAARRAAFEQPKTMRSPQSGPQTARSPETSPPTTVKTTDREVISSMANDIAAKTSVDPGTVSKILNALAAEVKLLA